MATSSAVITIIDYGVGNLRSIQNMLRYLGIDSKITSDLGKIARAGKLILPGVGKFDYGMTELRTRGMIEVLNRRVLEDGTPLLGICLGAQLLTRSSEEGELPGLGWIKGRTKRFDATKFDLASLRVPHMGWADTNFSDHPIAAGLNEARFYFVHSYHLETDEPQDVLCTTHYGYDFVAGVAHDNVVGVQFHPEKSHRFGMRVLQNFAGWK